MAPIRRKKGDQTVPNLSPNSFSELGNENLNPILREDLPSSPVTASQFNVEGSWSKTPVRPVEHSNSPATVSSSGGGMGMLASLTSAKPKYQRV